MIATSEMQVGPMRPLSSAPPWTETAGSLEGQMPREAAS